VSFWVYTDADNTLWDTNALFAEAQLTLLAAVEEFTQVRARDTRRLEFVRAYDQAIASRHHQRLRYPPVLLVRAICEGLLGVSPGVASEHALTKGAVAADTEVKALRAYEEVISKVPPILKGVRDGLLLAHERSMPVYVISEGPLETVRSRLRAHELEQLVAGALSAEKTTELYFRLRQRADPHPAVMIGDQPDRDIKPAHDAGLRTILIHGGFQPSWLNLVDANYADNIAEDLHEAIVWLAHSDACSGAKQTDFVT
jgi:putative hydrolase of the HAD superfamily